MTILALDLGTSCGWAVRDSSGDLHSGCWAIDDKKYPTRWQAFWYRLIDVNTAYGELEIVFEDVTFTMPGRPNHVYSGLRAILEFYTGARKIRLRRWHVGQIKKCLTGKGDAKKDLMLSAAQARWPEQNVRNHDQVDALAILYCHECGGLPLLATSKPNR